LTHILEKVLDEISFESARSQEENVKVDAADVTKQIADNRQEPRI